MATAFKEAAMPALTLIQGEASAASLSLDLPKNQSFDEWASVGSELASANKVLNWWIGDWWAAGSHRYGERAKVAAQGIFGKEFQTLMQLASVCRAFPAYRRRKDLTFTHHAEVAALRPEQADTLLDRAERENWSTRDLRAEVILARESRPPRWFETKPTTRYDREQVKEAVYERLVEAARVGAECPTADDLAEASGVQSLATTVAMMHILEKEERIVVDRFQKSRRVTIVATGEKTADPMNQAPHWRERPRDIPVPAPQSIAETNPTLAQEMWAAARRKGKSPQEFLADLVWLGWEVQCAIDDSWAGEATL